MLSLCLPICADAVFASAEPGLKRTNAEAALSLSAVSERVGRLCKEEW